MNSPADILIVSLLVAVVAALYSSVGHGGASGYLAILSFFAFTPVQMSSTALLLNVLVSLVSLIAFWRSSHVDLSNLWAYLVGSVPAALVGGLLTVPPRTYALMLGITLLVAAVRLAFQFRTVGDISNGTTKPAPAVAVGMGAGVGFLSGIVGIGGGIFLGPVILFKRWATVKQTAGICAGFILFNSLAGLLGRSLVGTLEIGSIGYFVPAALTGGVIGSYLGARRLPPIALRRILALVLVVAAVKLIVGSI